ncbi:MAG: chitobiase/beta-hexosaminidase C-terminal domain-containing protein, partial [Verrucomicrobia bacterium]|nr:chitobiase/beta-hexosaminidase C-terminal domain-containing protein [Verrucomicrobiota bacterium]
AEIRYTTDGRTPARTSLLYAGGFSLTNSAMVQARAFGTGLSGSSAASVTFTVLRSWQSAVLPETSSRDRHVALGTEGTNLFFTRGASANAGFYRIPKGAVTGWTTLAPIPLSTTVNGDSGVGEMGYLDGALWTLARNPSLAGPRSATIWPAIHGPTAVVSPATARMQRSRSWRRTGFSAGGSGGMPSK